MKSKDKIERMIKRRKRKKLARIFDNIILMVVVFLTISIIFDIPIINKFEFFIFVPLIGVSNYFLQEIQLNANIADVYEQNISLMENLIVQEKAITELQKLITDEDILERCNKEISEKLRKIEEDLSRRVEP